MLHPTAGDLKKVGAILEREGVGSETYVNLFEYNNTLILEFLVQVPRPHAQPEMVWRRFDVETGKPWQLERVPS